MCDHNQNKMDKGRFICMVCGDDNTPKRGPKFKPPEEHHTPRNYRHAPDVIKILDEIPNRERSRFVDDAIRFFSRKKAYQKIKNPD